ncbi:MAG: hypothetical protein K0B16_04775 [Burkholderiaceae bacterium]|nr:hypothetical protein [Burkholderiaceae bacterium]
MNRSYYRILPLLLWAAMIAGAGTPLAASARDQRMDPAEREQLRAELRDRYGEQRQRYEPRRQRGQPGIVEGARPEWADQLPRRRLSREEMQVLRQQLRDQRQGANSVPSERPQGDRGERRDRGSRNEFRERGNGGDRVDRGDGGEPADGGRRSRRR